MEKGYIIGSIINFILGIISIPVFIIAQFLLWPGSWSWPSSSSEEKIGGVIVLFVFVLVVYIVNKVVINKNPTLNIKTYIESCIIVFLIPIVAFIFYIN